MRVFVGFAMPEELAESALAYQERVAAVPGVRLLDRAGLHMTVIPPWEERQPDAVVRDFAAVDVPPLQLTFDVADYRDGRNDGQSLVWLRAAPTREVERAWLQVWRAVMSQDPPRKPYPHITLARFPAAAQLPELPLMQTVNALFDRLCLYESVGNLTYRIVGEKRLA